MERAETFGVILHKTDIYPAFMQTDNFNEFLTKLGFSEENIENISLICSYYDEWVDLKMILRRQEIH